MTVIFATLSPSTQRGAGILDLIVGYFGTPSQAGDLGACIIKNIPLPVIDDSGKTMIPLAPGPSMCFVSGPYGGEIVIATKTFPPTPNSGPLGQSTPTIAMFRLRSDLNINAWDTVENSNFDGQVNIISFNKSIQMASSNGNLVRRSDIRLNSTDKWQTSSVNHVLRNFPTISQTLVEERGAQLSFGHIYSLYTEKASNNFNNDGLRIATIPIDLYNEQTQGQGNTFWNRYAINDDIYTQNGFGISGAFDDNHNLHLFYKGADNNIQRAEVKIDVRGLPVYQNMDSSGRYIVKPDNTAVTGDGQAMGTPNVVRSGDFWYVFFLNKGGKIVYYWANKSNLQSWHQGGDTGFTSSTGPSFQGAVLNVAVCDVPRSFSIV